MACKNDQAVMLKSLHKPGKPIVLANVYDTVSARAVAALPECKALATASYAVVAASDLADDDMDMDTNLRAAKFVGKVAAEFKKPATVDIQDAYGDKLEECIGKLLDCGIHGVNLEDVDKDSGNFHSQDEAANRIKRALKVASDYGVKDFVVNARCDVLVHGGQLKEVIARGQAYLDAGATTVFVWGGSKRGVSREEVTTMVKEFDGRLNVSLKMSDKGMTVKQLAELGVARISVGPQIQFLAMATYAAEARKLLS